MKHDYRSDPDSDDDMLFDGLEMGAFAEDISLTVHPHPTLGEAVMEAAKHAIGEAVHIMNAKRRK